MKILLIDDSNTMRKIQKRVLSEMSFDDFTEAKNGQEALDILDANNYQFDLVLCDINMPIKNGIDTLKTIRSKTKDLKVVMCTSASDKPLVLEAIKLGISGYIVKPFQMEIFKESINSALAK